MRYLLEILAIVNAIVLLVALVFLARGPARKFWIVLVYIASELSANFGLAVADFFLSRPVGDAAIISRLRYAHLYWTSNLFLDLLRFLLVILLIGRAASGTGARPAVNGFLIGVVLAALILPFALFHPVFTPWPPGAWFNSASELLNFGAALMNLPLWATLIGSRLRDPQFLKVSAGLGVAVAGSALAYGLRHFIPPGSFRWLPNLFLMLSQLVGWLLWCAAFRISAPKGTAGTNPVATIG
jgi:hypothetical protein